MSDKLNELFDIDPESPRPEITIIEPENSTATLMKQEEEEVDVILSDKIKLDLDVDNVRVIQYDLIEKGKESLETMIEFAKDSESPRAWEVVAAMLKTTSEIANSLGELTMKKIKIISDSKSSKLSGTPGTNVTNNTVFVGDTATLQKMIRGENVDKEL